MWRSPFEIRLWRVWLVGIAAVGVMGCASVSPGMHDDTFALLVARQQAHAGHKAAPEEWTTLAKEFVRLAAARPTADMADDALFAAGICHIYRNSDSGFRSAIPVLEALIARYPDSPHLPNAVYWTARAYERTGDASRSARYDQMLVNRYPNSTYAQAVWKAFAPPPKTEETPLVVVLETAQAPASEPDPPVKVIEETPSTTAFISASPDPAPTQTIWTSPPAGELAVSGNSEPIIPQWQPPETGRLSPLQQLGFGVRTIVIDPGHGGKDPGAMAPGRPPEKEICLDIGKRLAALLEAQGFRVLMTRSDDTFIPLKERNVLAAKWKADLFVSIHVNSAGSASANGIETWVCAPARDERAARQAARENAGALGIHEMDDLLTDILVSSKNEESRTMARLIHDELAHATGSNGRGVKEAGLVVLAGLRVPSVLVEVGFISNPAEGQRLATFSYRQTLAEAIGRGIQQYAGQFASLTSTP